MNTTSAYMTVRGIDIDVVYKDIKNLHIGVYPPVGRVRVAAPLALNDEQVRLALVQRLPWIKRQRERLQNAERQSEREMVTGESHYAWGRRYRLAVREGDRQPRIDLVGDRMILSASPETSAERRRDALDRWYREQLRGSIPVLVERWEGRIGVEVPRWTVRQMKTKWGSCNRKTGHLWFNVELAKKHPDCLEYVVVHEMAHLLERGHGERFVALMDEFLPDWRARRDELNGAPLAEEEWPPDTPADPS